MYILEISMSINWDSQV